MSTDPSHTQEGEPLSPDERPARDRRRQLSVVAVAAAVLLAGGGGAYWASTSSGGGGAAGGGGTAAPPPLTLDDAGGQQAHGGSRSGGPAGIAPGEPAGSHPYRASGKLPDGPSSAAVYRAKGGVPRATVARLAKALGVQGKPQKQDDGWTVDSGDLAASGPRLTVSDNKSAGTWSYNGDNGDGASGGPGKKAPDHTTGQPNVSQAKAKSAVEPALKALGMQDSALDSGTTDASGRTVSAAPQVGGMPTMDWDSAFTVGSGGKVVHGHGSLGQLDKGAAYPVMSAQKTLDALNKQRAAGGSAPGGARTEQGPAARDEAKGKAEKAPETQSKGGKGGGASDPVKVTRARFGLVTHYDHGKPVLVPSWIYTADLPEGRTTQVAHPAVQARYLAQPKSGDSGDSGSGHASSKPGGGAGGSTAPKSFTSYKTDGHALKLSFWGGVCGTYKASADESGKSVKVTLRHKDTDSKKVCVKIAKRQTVEVKLDKPLDGRKVTDSHGGHALPVTK